MMGVFRRSIFFMPKLNPALRFVKPVLKTVIKFTRQPTPSRSLASKNNMKALWGLGLALTLLLAALPLSAVDGTFRGKVIDPPGNVPAAPGWIFVQGRNKALRRVNVSHADIVF